MRCTSEHILDFMEIDEDNAVVEIDTPKEWSTKSILKLDIRKHYGVTVLGVKEKERYNFQIGPDFIMEEDKKLLIFGSQQSIQKLVER